jgi:DNA-directed RNA polymerase specialized sigma subunit
MTDGQHQLTDAENRSYFDALWSGEESARQTLLDGNAHWVTKLVSPLADQSDIPIDRLVDAGMSGLAAAIEKYSDPAHKFQPDSNLEGGYAIWWVRMQIMRLAREFGYDYNAAANSVTPST